MLNLPSQPLLNQYISETYLTIFSVQIMFFHMYTLYVYIHISYILFYTLCETLKCFSITCLGFSAGPVCCWLHAAQSAETKSAGHISRETEVLTTTGLVTILRRVPTLTLRHSSMMLSHLLDMNLGFFVLGENCSGG